VPLARTSAPPLPGQRLPAMPPASSHSFPADVGGNLFTRVACLRPIYDFAAALATRKDPPQNRPRQHAVSIAYYESDFGLLLTGGSDRLAGARPNLGSRYACSARARDDIRIAIVAWRVAE
jgi:hypothetical protein